jgi:hypothetical protein
MAVCFSSFKEISKIIFIISERRSRVSSVGLATSCGLEGFKSLYGQEFSLLHVVQTGLWGPTQPPIQRVLKTLN